MHENWLIDCAVCGYGANAQSEEEAVIARDNHNFFKHYYIADVRIMKATNDA